MEKDKKIKTILKTLLLVFAAGIIITGGMLLYYMHGYRSDQKANDAVKEVAFITSDAAADNSENSSESEEKIIDFATLSSINREVIGWVSACGDDIDGPIVQTDNNDYYLTHLFDNSSGNAGCFFADAYSVPAFDCPFTVVYGHYRKDKSMFYPLHYYKDESYYKANSTFTIYTAKETRVYEIFSAFYGDYEADFEDIYEYAISSNNATSTKLQSLYDMAHSKSLYTIEPSTKATEALQQGAAEIVVLYTCEYSGVNNRMLIFGLTY